MEHKEDYKRVFSEMISNGYESHNTSTCGLHFHVTRPFYDEIEELDYNSDYRRELIEKQGNIIDRIILVMETYKDELMNFSRRSDSQMHWCQFLSDYKHTDKIDSTIYIKENKHGTGRYMALNLENDATIEFRLFRGTLKYETFMASVEFVNNIVTLCSDLSIPLKDITWDKLVAGEFAKTYSDERGISTSKVVVDNSEKEIKKIDTYIKSTKRLRKPICELYNMLLKDFTKGAVADNLTHDFVDIQITRISIMERYMNKIYTVIRDIETVNSGNYKHNVSDIRNIIADLLSTSGIDWVSTDKRKKLCERLVKFVDMQ